VKKVTKHYLLKECSKEMSLFLKGVYEVIPKHVISVLDHEELDLLLNGTPNIDLDDWKMNTSYKGEFTEKH